MHDELEQELIFEDELTKELLACESLCQLLDIKLDWLVQSTTAIRIAPQKLNLLCQLFIKATMKQGQLCRRIRLNSVQKPAGAQLVIHFDAATLLPDWHQNLAFIRFCYLARQSGWQVKLCHTERLKRLQLFVPGEVLVADSADASNRQIRRDGLADYGQYIGGEQRYRPCILLFEPNNEIRRFIASLLQNDYLVLLVPDDSQLLEWVKREQPDLILADVLAAKPDALALIRQLSQDQACRHIPLFVLSGFKDLATKTECLLAGAVDYFCKPFHAAELLLKIRNQIRQSIAFTLLADKSHYLARLQTDVAARDLRFTKRLDQLIDANYQLADFSIPALAALLGSSERQLQRRCLRIYQSSPAEYLQEFRLQRAKALLQQGQTLQSVAYGCGFSSDQYFSKCFKKRFGITPAMLQKGR
ncbi:helix-turn-helix domain-containing protein [Rheinheimera riviphila]|uniref:helix-turn-helix domain-containing protein n=1 Tax=Rheinheimera riviphila TaxID=1834037 RepID=UPI0013E40D86|nr:helix-turn-helix domain-containing protein [Rheinheimera riviphila]